MRPHGRCHQPPIRRQHLHAVDGVFGGEHGVAGIQRDGGEVGAGLLAERLKLVGQQVAVAVAGPTRRDAFGEQRSAAGKVAVGELVDLLNVSGVDQPARERFETDCVRAPPPGKGFGTSTTGSGRPVSFAAA